MTLRILLLLLLLGASMALAQTAIRNETSVELQYRLEDSEPINDPEEPPLVITNQLPVPPLAVPQGHVLTQAEAEAEALRQLGVWAGAAAHLTGQPDAKTCTAVRSTIGTDAIWTVDCPLTRTRVVLDARTGQVRSRERIAAHHQRDWPNGAGAEEEELRR